jgi:hypothetical protein
MRKRKNMADKELRDEAAETKNNTTAWNVFGEAQEPARKYQISVQGSRHSLLSPKLFQHHCHNQPPEGHPIDCRAILH